MRQLELAGRVDQDDLPIDDEGHAVAEGVGDGHVVGGEEDGAAGRLLLADQVLDAAGADGVEAGRRLVQKEQFGPIEQRPRESKAHLHALGVGLHPRITGLHQIDHLQQAGEVWRGIQIVERGEEFQVLAPCELLVVVGKLEGNPDVFEEALVPTASVAFQDPHLALIAL